MAGGAVLQAAGIDEAHLLAGVVALEPNVHIEGSGRTLYDYATEAALYLPCALADAHFSATPFARVRGALAPAWSARCARLREAGLIGGADIAAQARSALDHLLASGWDERTLESAASTTAFDLWRSIAATYASAYLRAPAGAMPCGFHFGAIDARGSPCAPDIATRAAWWADASGIPPGAGAMLLGASDASNDPTAVGIDGLRALWTGAGAEAVAVRASVAATAARIARAQLPIIVAQGEGDGLLPIAFSSAPYVAALEHAAAVRSIGACRTRNISMRSSRCRDSAIATCRCCRMAMLRSMRCGRT